MNIFVGGLLESVTIEGLEKTFSVYGKVNSVTLAKDHNGGGHRGFGYVEMPVNTEAAAAIAALHGHSRLGSQLEIHEICRPAPRVSHVRTTSRMSSGGTRRPAVKSTEADKK